MLVAFDGCPPRLHPLTGSSAHTARTPSWLRMVVDEAPLRPRTLTSDCTEQLSLQSLPLSPSGSVTGGTDDAPAPLSQAQHLGTSPTSRFAAAAAVTLTPTASQWTARQSVLGALSIVPPSHLVEAPYRTVSDCAPPPMSLSAGADAESTAAPSDSSAADTAPVLPTQSLARLIASKETRIRSLTGTTDSIALRGVISTVSTLSKLLAAELLSQTTSS
jgi:nucleoid-associated protein YgaU